MNNEKVTCIIPAYNEEQRIGAVIKTALSSNEINELIIVNDGSTDGTASVIANYRNASTNNDKSIKIINFEKNQGKGAAMDRGIKEASGQIILFLDADLKGLTSEHISSLINPVANHQVDMTLSYRDNSGEPFFKIDIFSGERVLRRSVLQAIGNMNGLGYAVEAAINRYVIENGLTWQSVICKGLTFVQKEEKMKNNLFGTLSHYKMYWDINKKVPGILQMYWVMGRKQIK